MRPLRLPRSAVLGLLATSQALAGCPQRPSPPPRSPRAARGEPVLRVRLPADLPRLPCVMQGHTWCDRVLVDSVYEPLVRWDTAREEFVGVLATSWRYGEQGKVFRLTLRSGVRWHDGRPFGAADVKHSLERLRSAPLEREHPAAVRLWSRLDRVSFRSEGEIELRFTKPFGPALEILSAIPLQQAPPRPAGDGTPPPPTRSDEDRVVGTGPLRFVQWWPGEKLVLGRWDGYWGRAATASRLEYLVIPSLEGVVEKLRKGALDLVLDLDTRTYRALLARLGRTVHPFTVEPAGYTQLAFNCKQAPYKDPRVRRALAMLIDRKKLVSGLVGPRPTLMTGPVWPHGPQRQAALGTIPPHDPDQAARLLAEAGWALKAGRWRKDGQSLQLAVHTPERSEGINRGLRVLRDDLAKAGVSLVVKKRIWGEIVRDLRHHKFGAALFATPLSGPWTDLGILFSPAGNHYGYAPEGWEKQVDRILEDIRPTRRLARERRLLQSMGRDVPFLVLEVPRSLGVSRHPIRTPKKTYIWFDIARIEPH